jgi:hypothetical protein
MPTEAKTGSDNPREKVGVLCRRTGHTKRLSDIVGTGRVWAVRLTAQFYRVRIPGANETARGGNLHTECGRTTSSPYAVSGLAPNRGVLLAHFPAHGWHSLCAWHLSCCSTGRLGLLNVSTCSPLSSPCDRRKERGVDGHVGNEGDTGGRLPRAGRPHVR